ncbi:hypothetical protein GCM10010306_098750 [Streptomyces umbrinus]|nr:hypothetical protein GCM10010306_098750 [Streptomyces umbrinus]
MDTDAEEECRRPALDEFLDQCGLLPFGARQADEPQACGEHQPVLAQPLPGALDLDGVRAADTAVEVALGDDPQTEMAFPEQPSHGGVSGRWHA